MSRVGALLVAVAALHRADLRESLTRHLQQWLEERDAAIFGTVRRLKAALGDLVAAETVARAHHSSRGLLPLDILPSSRPPPPQSGGSGSGARPRLSSSDSLEDAPLPAPPTRTIARVTIFSADGSESTAAPRLVAEDFAVPVRDGVGDSF